MSETSLARPQVNAFDKFEDFVRLNSRASPLYGFLASEVIKAPEILEITRHTRARQPLPHMLFAAVQFLLARHGDHALARIWVGAQPNSEVFSLFRDFVVTYRDEIIELLKTRRVQTNEVRRMASLLPAFLILDNNFASEPVHYVEIGASAGLSLNFPRYGFTYGDGRIWGQAQSPVLLRAEFRGPHRPVLPGNMPAVASIQGIEIDPLDVAKDEDCDWLRALIWPEQAERRERLEAALAIARRHRPVLRAGDATEILPEILAELPGAVPVCIFHSFVLNQIALAERQFWAKTLEAFSFARPVYRVTLEMIASERPILELTVIVKGKRTQQTLAYGDPHGETIEWLLP